MAAKLQTKEVSLFLLFQWLDDRKLYRMYHYFWLYPAHDFLVRSYLPYLLLHKKMLQFQRVAVDSGQMVDCERVGSFVNQNGEGTKQWYQCSPKVCWENQCLLEYLSNPSLVFPSSASPCLLSVSTASPCLNSCAVCLGSWLFGTGDEGSMNVSFPSAQYHSSVERLRDTGSLCMVTKLGSSRVYGDVG